MRVLAKLSVVLGRLRLCGATATVAAAGLRVGSRIRWWIRVVGARCSPIAAEEGRIIKREKRDDDDDDKRALWPDGERASE